MDLNLVSRLELVDLGALGTDKLTMILGVDLEDMGCFVSELFAERCDMALGSLSLSLRTFQFDFAFIDIDFNIELVPKFPDVAASLTNKLVGMLLREVE